MNKTLLLIVALYISSISLSQTAASSAIRFNASMNINGVLNSESKVLQYNSDVSAITFLNQKTKTYNPTTGGNPNSMVAYYSTTKGSTWDSTCIWSNSTDLANGPQGVLFNPAGNTLITNAYMVGCGSISNGILVTGNWYASKKITIPGNATAGIDQQSMINASLTGSMKKHHFSSNSMTFTKDGYVRSLALVLNDPNNSSSLGIYGLRGSAIIKGTFVAGAFVWSYDSLIPNTMTRLSNGSKYLNDKPIMAWNDAGTVGYVVMLGVRSGVGASMQSYQPIVYKTTNSGASWLVLPANDFSTSLFQGVISRMRGINSAPCTKIPFFSTNEGWDATVDVNDNLHIACTVLGAKTLHPDSLDQTFTFGSQKYNFQFNYSPYPNCRFGFPTIYDFNTTSSGGWNYELIDSMGTEYVSGDPSMPSFSSNTWSNGVGGSYDLNARIQMSISTDRKKIIYSWLETDTIMTGGAFWNRWPDLKMRGYDVTTNKKTQRLNATGTTISPYNIAQSAYFDYVSPRAINTTSTIIEIPATACVNLSQNGSLPVDHIYLKGITFSASSFSLNSTPVGGPSCFGVSVNSIQKEDNSISVFPVPSTGNVTISWSENYLKPIRIKICNVSGQLLESREIINEKQILLDLSFYKPGFYFLNIEAENKITVKKLVLE